MKLAEKTTELKDANRFEGLLKDTAALVDQEINRLLPRDNSILTQAMRYSCLELKGKKIRPFLLIETAKILGIEFKDIIQIAAAIELIHVYTLIHDDLPSMDNDDFRRGKPSCHKKFDEATAILAGNALLIYAFEIITQCNHIPLSNRMSIIATLTNTIGFNGTIKGQHYDIEFKSKQVSEDELINLHTLKTSKLISFACVAATLVVNCSEKARISIENFAKNLGLIFQITDDILDSIENTDNNTTKHECNIVNILGQKRTEEILHDLLNNAIVSLEIFGPRANTLKALINFVLNRKS